MYCSEQQVRLIRFFSFSNAKTGYGCLDTAKSLDNSLWSLSRSRSPKFEMCWIRSGVAVKNFRLRTPLTSKDDHYPVCRWDIRQDSEFATGYGYPKAAFKREPDTDPDIRNAFSDISRIKIFEKSCTLHSHSFIIFRSIFSAFRAMTPSLSMV